MFLRLLLYRSLTLKKNLGSVVLVGTKPSCYEKTLNLINHFHRGRDNFSRKEKTKIICEDIKNRLPGGLGDQNARLLVSTLGDEASIQVINLINEYYSFITPQIKGKSDALLFSTRGATKALTFRKLSRGEWNLYDIINTLLATSSEFREKPIPGMKIKINFPGKAYKIDKDVAEELSKDVEALKMSDEERQKYRDHLQKYINASPSIRSEIHHIIQESRGGPNKQKNAQVTINAEHGLCHFMENIQRLYIVGKPVFPSSKSMSTRGISKKYQ